MKYHYVSEELHQDILQSQYKKAKLILNHKLKTKYWITL